MGWIGGLTGFSHRSLGVAPRALKAYPRGLKPLFSWESGERAKPEGLGLPRGGSRFARWPTSGDETARYGAASPSEGNYLYK